MVECTPEPATVPAVGVDRRDHGLSRRPQPRRLPVVAPLLGDCGQLAGRDHEEAGDEHRLGNPALEVLGHLERLARSVREAV